MPAVGHGAEGTAVPQTPADAVARPAPLPLAEVAQRSDDLAVYLRQLEERLAPDEQVRQIEAELRGVAERVRELRSETTRTVSASPALREVDELLDQWEGVQGTLTDWSEIITGKVTVVDAELQGVAELRGIWEATREAAQAAAAPAPLRDRVRAALGQIQQTRKHLEAYRQRLLLLQDRLVQESTRAREGMEQLTEYRRSAVNRLLVPDAQPIWAAERWRIDWSAALAAHAAQLRDSVAAAGGYARVQLARVPFQAALFVLVMLIWQRARRRTARWREDDDSIASFAAVFERPIASALFLTLLSTRWFYPQLPPLLRVAARVAAMPPLLRALTPLVDPPIVPGLYALAAFFAVDQLRALLAPLPLVEQLLFMVELLVAVLVLLWLVRSGRVAQLRASRSARVVSLLDRAALVIAGLLAVALLAAVLGFMQLARVLGGAVLGSGYAAMLLFAVQRFAQGLWAYLLRSRALRRLRAVQHHRALLQQRGERALSWLAGGLWVLITLARLEVLEPTRAALREVLTAEIAFGAVSLSLGDVVAFAVAVWLAVLASRAVRFVLQEEVYPRVALPRGMPFTLSTLAHYTVLLLGILVGLAAAGVELDRFALLAGAVGVGIGFGMQNIVNNFVSGLILLFERPLQVGDTVQIADLNGEIRRIGIRSSTVRTFDGAEVIVPNANLISAPVTNWTLTDRMRRIDIPVTAAYGSDPEQVLEVLRSVAATHPLVVDAPAPHALFLGFGETALSFELRVWTDRFERWTEIRSELAVAVFKALPDAGIAIPTVPREPYRGERAADDESAPAASGGHGGS